MNRSQKYLFEESVRIALKCTQCGAGMAHGDRRCNYCGTSFARARKPIQNQPIARSGRRLSERGHDHCPRCHHKLFRQRVAGNYIRGCRQCNGIWLSHRLLATLNHRRKKRRRRIEKLNRKKRQLSPFTQNKHKLVRCPECHDRMSAEIFHGSGAVVVDICPRHGIWFDADELRKARSSISQRHLNFSTHREWGFDWGSNWDINFRRGWRHHPLYWILRIVVELIGEILD